MDKHTHVPLSLGIERKIILYENAFFKDDIKFPQAEALLYNST